MLELKQLFNRADSAARSFFNQGRINSERIKDIIEPKSELQFHDDDGDKFKRPIFVKHEDQQKRRPSSPLGLSARLLSAVRQTFGHQQLGHSTFGQQLWDTLLLDSTSWDTALHWIWTLEAVTLFGKRHPLTDDHAKLE